jgi:hypothetical protein
LSSPSSSNSHYSSLRPARPFPEGYILLDPEDSFQTSRPTAGLSAECSTWSMATANSRRR